MESLSERIGDLNNGCVTWINDTSFRDGDRDSDEVEVFTEGIRDTLLGEHYFVGNIDIIGIWNQLNLLIQNVRTIKTQVERKIYQIRQQLYQIRQLQQALQEAPPEELEELEEQEAPNEELEEKERLLHAYLQLNLVLDNF